MAQWSAVLACIVDALLLLCCVGMETCCATFRGEQRLRVFGNRVLRGTCGPEWGKEQETGENYMMVSFIIGSNVRHPRCVLYNSKGLGMLTLTVDS